MDTDERVSIQETILCILIHKKREWFSLSFFICTVEHRVRQDRPCTRPVKI